MTDRAVFIRRLGLAAGSGLALALMLAAAPAAAQTAQATPLPIVGASLGVIVKDSGDIYVTVDASAGKTTTGCGSTGPYCYDEYIMHTTRTTSDAVSMPALHFIAPPIIGGDGNVWTYVQYVAPSGVAPGPSVHLQTGATTQCGLVSIRADDNFTFYPVQSEVCGQNRSDMVKLNDNNFWLVGAESNLLINLHLAKISSNGAYTRIPLSMNGLPSSYLAVADDSKSNVWFAGTTGKLARYTTTAYTGGPAVGTVTEFSIASGRTIKALKRGSDGNVWFIEASATSTQNDSIGFVTPDGVVTEYTIPGSGAVLSKMIQGRDGTIWYLNSIDSEADTGPVRVGRITADGAVSETPIPDFGTLTRGLGFQAGGRAITSWALASDRAYFTLRPATTIASWDYNHAALASSTATFFPVRATSIYASSQTTSGSFLRFFNTGTVAGSVTLQLRNPAGQLLGTWTSPSIGPNVEVQYHINAIEAALGINPADNTQYSISLETQITGNFQHVLYRPADGTLTNLSTCNVGVNAENRAIAGVHSSLLGTGFPSSIAIRNTGTSVASAQLGIYDARDGRKLTNVIVNNTSTRKFDEPQVGPTEGNGLTVVTMSYLETQASLTPPAGAYHYVIKLENSDFTGFLQHLVNNTKLGVVTDMTTSCSFNGGTGTAASTVRAAPIFSPAQASAQSYLRFFNPTGAAGTVTVALYDSNSGANAGSWTSPSIAAGAERQFSISDVTSALGTSTTKPYFGANITATFRGYFQDVLYRPADGTLTNLSTCAAGVTASSAWLSGVHTSRIPDFPSSVVVVNTGSVASAFTLGIYDARDGTKRGTYTTPSIAANGRVVIAVTTMESAAGIAPAEDMFHYNLRAEGAFSGFLQHLVDNKVAGVITDMTTACAIAAQ